MTDFNKQQLHVGVTVAIIGSTFVAVASLIMGQKGTKYFWGALATGLYFVGMNNVVGDM